MLDIRLIRSQPELVRAALARRPGEAGAKLDELLATDEERRRLLQESEELKHRKNTVSQEISQLKRSGQDAAPQMTASREISERIKTLDDAVREADERVQTLMLDLPNLPDERVPPGESDQDNVVLRTHGEPRRFDFTPKPHWDLGPALGIIQFDWGVKLSGSRFYVLQGLGARLQRALIQWMLDVHSREQGYTEVYPPFMVREEVLWNAGQLPKFRDNLYHDAEEDYWMVPTAEVPVTSLYAGEILEPGSLPLNYTAYTACFRREKMSAGRDVRGLKRGHQFDKVEMYKFTLPETSDAELDRLVADAEAICQGLQIPYRILQQCTGDLGFASAITYDLEMWAPGVGEWLEVSSCSNDGDFQARRANIRFRREPGAKPEFCHTLNGSGLGLPRTLIAVLENYQQEDGSVIVPEVLRPYMGVERITPEKG
jgi:seryl-tRNA synthetase